MALWEKSFLNYLIKGTERKIKFSKQKKEFLIKSFEDFVCFKIDVIANHVN